jgi:hypothetical protein
MDDKFARALVVAGDGITYPWLLSGWDHVVGKSSN